MPGAGRTVPGAAGGRHPGGRQGWDLNLSLVRDDLDDAALAVLEHQFPGLGIGRGSEVAHLTLRAL
jgi:hypothetical protein